MTMNLFGQVGQTHVREYVTRFLVDYEIPIVFAQWIAEARWFPRDFQVYLVDRQPMVRCGDDLIPYAESVYHIQRDVYTPNMRHYDNHALVPGLYWPMLPRWVNAMTFREFIDKMDKYGRTLHERNPELSEWAPDGDLIKLGSRFKTDYQSHFFGAKSEKVVWRVAHDPEEINGLCVGLQDLYREHLENVQSRFPPHPENPMTIDDDVEFWLKVPKLSNVFMVYAVDLDNGDVPCAMVNYMYLNAKTVDCDAIAVSHDPKYKPYSLVTCAILKAAEVVLSMRMTDNVNNGKIWDCNFGRTPVESLLYKAPYSHFEPIIGIQLQESKR